MKKLLPVLISIVAISLLPSAFAVAEETSMVSEETSPAKEALAEPSEDSWTYSVQVAWGEGVEPRPVYVTMFNRWGHTFTEENGWRFPLNITSDIAPSALVFGKDVAEVRHAGTYVDDNGIVHGVEREDGRFDISYSVEADEALHTAVITITNNYKDVELVSVPVSIVWDDNNNVAGMRPTSCAFDITMNGQWSPNSVVVSEKNGWTGTIEDWEAYDEKGEAIDYGIYWFDDSWMRALGYTGELTGNMSDGYTITWTFDEGLVDWETIAQGPPDRAGSGVALATGWVKTGKTWRYVKDGAILTGWQRIDGDWYLLQSSGQDVGAMLTGWQKVGGKWYFLKGSGRMETGWHKAKDGSWYYLKASGAMATGWQKVNEKWYYLDKSGKMHTGWVESGSKRYFLDKKSGAMRTGWLKSDGNWYYLDKSSGAMQAACWLKSGGSWYYLAGGGEMVSDLWIGYNNGYMYHVGKDGKWDGGKQPKPRDY